MGINPWKILKLDKDVSWQEIEEKLSADSNIDSAKYKSIFEKIAGTDGILSQNEWNTFCQKCDGNRDGNLTFTEIKSCYSKVKNEIIKLYNLIKDIVTTRTNNTTSAKSTENQEVYIDEPIPNKYRAQNSKSKGTFTEKWLERDKYGSKTYEEWITNLAKDGYEYDEDLANKILEKRESKDVRKIGENCSMAVTDTTTKIFVQRLVINEDTGDEEIINDVLFEKKNRQQYAYQNASEYAKNPNFKELPHNIVATMDLTTLPKGCIIVYDANYKTSWNAKEYKDKYHIYGHIGISDGTGSDVAATRWPIVQEEKDTKIRVFVPVKNITKQAK